MSSLHQQTFLVRFLDPTLVSLSDLLGRKIVLGVLDLVFQKAGFYSVHSKLLEDVLETRDSSFACVA